LFAQRNHSTNLTQTLRMTSFYYSLPHFKALSKTILALGADGRQIEIVGTIISLAVILT
jgi:hypothetical protein